MAGIVSSTTLEQVRAASDIVEVVGGFVKLKRAGGSFVGLCPFHKEKSPSFHVNPQRQIFHCFGCHKGGDVFRFVQEFENVGFPEALKRLAERAHIVLRFEGGGSGGGEGAGRKELLRDIHEQVAQRWQAALVNDPAAGIARAYLAKRGVSAEAVKLFRLGYSPASWDDTVNWAKSKGHELGVLEEAGLVARRDGGGYYGRFRGRLMFPICDDQARVIGFSGRVLEGDEKTAKYVNSPETPIFTKGRVIYGLDKSKRALLDAGSAVVCEGQLDLIACYMAGVQNVVAPQGTALTAEHARILKRYVEEVVLCFDADNAGLQATIRALDDLLGSGLAVRVARVPPPHDPDSYIKAHGGAAFQRVIAESEGFFDFYLAHLAKEQDVGTDRGRLAIVRSMVDALKKTGSPVLMDTYMQKVAARLGVSIEALREEARRLLRREGLRSKGVGDGGEKDITAPPPPPPPSEQWLLRLLLVHEELVPPAVGSIQLEWLTDARVREVVAARFKRAREGDWQGFPAFLEGFEEGEVRRLLTSTVSDGRELPEPEKQLRDVLATIEDRFLERRGRELRARLQEANLPSEEAGRIGQELVALTLRRKREAGRGGE